MNPDQAAPKKKTGYTDTVILLAQNDDGPYKWDNGPFPIQNTCKGSLTLAMGKCLWFSVKIKVCQWSLSSP